MADQAAVIRLAKLRLKEAESALSDSPLVCSFRFGEYSHFNTPRGFGVTFSYPNKPCEVVLSDKLTRSSLSRVDAIIRHEIGHVIDLSREASRLNAWALDRGVKLPNTQEVRADKIAEAVWGEPILYDSDTVQNTRTGQRQRPPHLGL